MPSIFLRFRFVLLAGLGLLSVVTDSGGLSADQFHLEKGVIEGEVVEESPLLVRVATLAGEIAIPANIIHRRVEGPSLREAYESRLPAGSLTLRQHLDIADWCEQAGLPLLARQHATEALKINPSHTEARRRAGYVRVGDMWLSGRSTDNSPLRTAEDEALVERLLGGWHQVVRTILQEHLSDGASPRSIAEGRLKLLALREPLAVQPACLVLGGAGEEGRRALVQMLARQGHDDAILHLVILSLLDPSVTVRDEANSAIAAENDPRVVRFMRGALHSRREVIVHRSADALARLGDKTSVPKLVTLLPSSGVLPDPVSSTDLFANLQRLFNQPTAVPLGEHVYAHPSRIAFGAFQRGLNKVISNDEPVTGQFRSYVQDALIEITGENFGFDVAAWRDWAARNLPRG